MATAAQKGRPAPTRDSADEGAINDSGSRWLDAALTVIILGASLAWFGLLFGLLYKLVQLLL